MKRLLIILIVSFVCLSSYSQWLVAGETQLNGADTIYQQTDLMKQASYSIMMQVAIKDTIGSPAGFSVLQGSIDAMDWATLNTEQYVVYASNDDTLTYNTTTVNIWALSGLPFNYLRVMSVGSVGDTLTVRSVYQTKKY